MSTKKTDFLGIRLYDWLISIFVSLGVYLSASWVINVLGRDTSEFKRTFPSKPLNLCNSSGESVIFWNPFEIREAYASPQFSSRFLQPQYWKCKKIPREGERIVTSSFIKALRERFGNSVEITTKGSAISLSFPPRRGFLLDSELFWVSLYVTIFLDFHEDGLEAHGVIVGYYSSGSTSNPPPESEFTSLESKIGGRGVEFLSSILDMI